MATAVAEHEAVLQAQAPPLCVIVDYSMDERRPVPCTRVARWIARDWCANGHQEENLICHHHRDWILQRDAAGVTGVQQGFACDRCGYPRGPVPTQWIRL